MHYFGLLAFYMLAQFLLAISVAYISSKSQLNSFRNLRDYFATRWPPLALRWLLSLSLFMLVWNNPHVMNLDAWVPTYAMQMGLCGIFGWVSDSVLDKVIALIFPGVHKELPPIPPPVEP